MYIDTLGLGGLDYFPCRYGNSKLSFRGPKRSLDAPYVACVGGTNTYGKFIERPYPDLLESALGVSCVNFGCVNAGLDVVMTDPFLKLAVRSASLTVVQVLSPRNMTNRFYAVHPRRNDRFLKPTLLLKDLYHEVDFSEFNFTKHMLTHLHRVSPDRFELVIDELQEAWLSSMQHLLRSIPGKVILLWLSDHAPGETCQPMGIDPWFVTQPMLDAIRPMAADYVEVVASLGAMSAGTDGMVYSEMEAFAAKHVLGPAAHVEISSHLVNVVKRHLEE